MLHYIKGVITETMPGMVCIENSGIGYEVYVPENSRAYLTQDGEIITAIPVAKYGSFRRFGETKNSSVSLKQSIDKLFIVIYYI